MSYVTKWGNRLEKRSTVRNANHTIGERVLHRTRSQASVLQPGEKRLSWFTGKNYLVLLLYGTSFQTWAANHAPDYSLNLPVKRSFGEAHSYDRYYSRGLLQQRVIKIDSSGNVIPSEDSSLGRRHVRRSALRWDGLCKPFGARTKPISPKRPARALPTGSRHSTQKSVSECPLIIEWRM